MPRCGIDVGSTICKIAVLGDDAILLHSAKMQVGGDPESACETLFKGALKTLQLKGKDLAPVTLTGRNSEHVSFKGKKVPELAAIAAGGLQVSQTVRTIIDTGSFTNKVIRTNPRGQVMDYQTNDKCAAGAGIFIELVCKSLDISIEEVGTIALQAKHPVPVSSQCSIFAESEVIYLMNDGHDVPDIAAGVCESVVGRLVPLVAKVGLEQDVLLVGGVGKNVKVQRALEGKIGVKLLPCNADPQYVAALGAAVLAGGQE